MQIIEMGALLAAQTDELASITSRKLDWRERKHQATTSNLRRYVSQPASQPASHRMEPKSSFLVLMSVGSHWSPLIRQILALS